MCFKNRSASYGHAPLLGVTLRQVAVKMMYRVEKYYAYTKIQATLRKASFMIVKVLLNKPLNDYNSYFKSYRISTHEKYTIY